MGCQVAAWIFRGALELFKDQPPIDLAGYNEIIPALPNIPSFKPHIDTTGSTGPWGGGGEGTTDADLLTRLNNAQRIELLKLNGIDIIDEAADEGDIPTGNMRAYVVSDNSSPQLAPQAKPIVRFKKVRISTSDSIHESYSYSYSKFESDLQQQSAAGSTADGGIPGIFTCKSNYKCSSATATTISETSIYSLYRQIYNKARLEFEPKDIYLDQWFVKEVELIVETANLILMPSGEYRYRTGSEKNLQTAATKLLAHFKAYGEFVPLNLQLGGQVLLTDKTQLNDRRDFNYNAYEFSLAAKARFSVEGIPVQAGAGTSLNDVRQSEAQNTSQTRNLNMFAVGGIPELFKSVSAPGVKGGTK